VENFVVVKHKKFFTLRLLTLKEERNSKKNITKQNKADGKISEKILKSLR
jgi:hypothetical protein